jgi:phenylpyruvate tautomerase PptA (4-oxalocrotonate tautomerase family)
MKFSEESKETVVREITKNIMEFTGVNGINLSPKEKISVVADILKVISKFTEGKH